MEKIAAFTMGDSNDISTWSNVPFLFLKALQDNYKNLEISRKNIRVEDSNITVKYLQKIFNKLLKMIGHGGGFSFKRTKIYEMLVRKSMKKICERK